MAISKKRSKVINAVGESAIDYSDAPELSDEFWQKAELTIPGAKQGVYIRLDSDVLEWFKGQGRGYQTRINAILRAYYETQSDAGSKR